MIPKTYLDLDAGLTRVRGLNQRLQSEWQPLIARQSQAADQAYAAQVQGAAADQAAGDQLHKAARTQKWAGISLIGLGLFVTCPGMFCVWSFNIQAQNPDLFYGLLAALGVLVIILVGLGARAALRADDLTAEAEARAKATRAVNPARAPAERQNIPNLAELSGLWWKQIETEAAAEVRAMAADAGGKEGDAGEAMLMEALKRALPNTYFALRSARVVENLDVDILLFGPTGIWVLESKYWSGQVTYANERWSRRKEYYGPRGVLQQRDEAAADFHKQWRRECDIVYKILKTSMPGWRFKIEGGLVFTHPDVVLKIDKSCPVNVGTINGWVKRIKAAPLDPDMTERDLLLALDVVLTVAHQYNGSRSKSSVVLAEQLYKQQQNKLKSWTGL